MLCGIHRSHLSREDAMCCVMERWHIANSLGKPGNPIAFVLLHLLYDTKVLQPLALVIM